MKYLIFLIVLLFCSCTEIEKSSNNSSATNNRIGRIILHRNYIDSLHKVLEWQEKKPNLWSNINGEFGIKTVEGNEEGITIDRFITGLCCEGKSLRSTIDAASFEFIGSSFYRDKNHIYTHFVMADGGNFWIVETADVETFEVIGDCYAKDKNHIFGERSMEMDSVDYKTFKTTKGVGCFAKDKHRYYHWDDKIDPESLNDSIGQETLQDIFNKF